MRPRSNTEMLHSSHNTQIRVRLTRLTFRNALNKPASQLLWETVALRAVCDSLQGLKTGILHDSAGGETEGIGVSQEVGRDRGATLFLG